MEAFNNREAASSSTLPSRSNLLTAEDLPGPSGVTRTPIRSHGETSAAPQNVSFFPFFTSLYFNSNLSLFFLTRQHRLKLHVVNNVVIPIVQVTDDNIFYRQHISEQFLL